MLNDLQGLGPEPVSLPPEAEMRAPTPGEMHLLVNLIGETFLEADEQVRTESMPGAQPRAAFVGGELASCLVFSPGKLWMGRDMVPTGTVSAVATAAHHAAPAAGDDWVALSPVYEKFARLYNCCLVRDEALWRRQIAGLAQERGLGGRRFVYLWYASPEAATRREASGYIIFRFQNVDPERPWERRLLVRELVALDDASWRGLLGFLARHDFQAREVVMGGPLDCPLPFYLDDPRIEVRREPLFAFRLVSVPEALQARRYPVDLGGTFTLSVQDPLCPWNQGVLRVKVQEGRAEVEKLTLVTGLSADLACPVAALSSLYCSYLTPRQAADAGWLAVGDGRALALLQGMLAGRLPFLWDWF
ncbi:MAG TPA: hypothetical protein GX513_11065 [Firmicutes bacterium]|nr:hypothetical protein [Bacillota bacterium]